LESLVEERVGEEGIIVGQGEHVQTVEYDELWLWWNVLISDEHVVEGGGGRKRVEKKVKKVITALYGGTVGVSVTEHTDEDGNSWITADAHT